MNTNVPLVSIVTACYNSEKYISKTIKSVLNQTYQNWELLLVDDCSSDNTMSILKEFQKADGRIRVLGLKKNSGAAISRNKAIEEAKGRFIAFLDSDDKWLPLKLEKQIDFMLKNGYHFTHTAYECVDDKGLLMNKTITPQQELTYKDLLYSNQIGCLTAIYDQGKLGKMYMPLLRKRQDYGLWLKILKTEKKAYAMPDVLSQYRIVENSISSHKPSLLKWNWKLFKEVEGLSSLKSAYYLTWNVLYKLKKI